MELKPDFDITQHEWSDVDITGALPLDNYLILDAYLSGEDEQVHLEKSDAIAIARHFKLKPEDLT